MYLLLQDVETKHEALKGFNATLAPGTGMIFLLILPINAVLINYL